MRRLVYIGLLMMIPLFVWAEEERNDLVLCDAGIACYNKGDYQKAKEYFLQAIEIRDSIYGRSGRDFTYSTYLAHLGNTYHQIGDYSNAVKYLSRGRTICAQNGGTKTYTYAWILQSLGDLLYQMGNAEYAEECYQTNLDIYKQKLPQDPEKVAQGLVSLGNVSCLKKDYSRAKQYYNEALEQYESASAYRNLGHLYYLQKDYQQAEKYYLKALRSSDKKDPLLRETLYCDLGSVYNRLQQYKRAEKYLSRVKSNSFAACNELGFLYTAQKKFESASTYYAENMRHSKELFVNVTTNSSEKQREMYWETVQAYHNIDFPRYAYRAQIAKPTSSAFAYDNELFRKSLLLTSTQAIRRAILETGDPWMMEELKLIEEMKNDTIEKYRYRAEVYERSLTSAVSSKIKNLRQWSITWDSVRGALKPNQVAIEFMAAPLNEDSTMYCALLLRHDSKQPKLIPLFNEKDVKSQLNKSTINQADISRTYAHDERGGRLAKLVWSAILPYLKETDEVYFSPTGVLHQLAIENLPFDATGSMADHYNLYRLSSTRELALNRHAVTYQTATLYGGISYAEMSDSAMIANSQKYATRGCERLADDESFDETLRSTITKELPGTAEEVTVIAPILEKQHIAVSVFMNDTANEESVKALSGQKKNLLHFATHGFFLPDNGSGKDPLERSGLVFAGVDKRLRLGNKGVPENVDDGILTSKEIALLDLREADIVVLSACETGLGDISGDGVFGLQRAFKMAGAQTILMALWQVSDEATRMLMTAFYRHYTAGESKREAFRNAQKEVRSSKYKSPYFWAGFVLLD